MNKIMFNLFVFVLFCSSSYAFDYKTTVETVGFEYEYQLSNYVKMSNAGNSEGKSEALKHVEIIKSGSIITVDRIVFENEDILVGKFIVDGHGKFLYAFLRKGSLLPPSMAPDNSATDAILKKKP